MNSNFGSSAVMVKNISTDGVNSVGKALISIENDTSIISQQSLMTNIYLEGISITNWDTSLSLIYINATNLIWTLNKLNIQRNTQV